MADFLNNFDINGHIDHIAFYSFDTLFYFSFFLLNPETFFFFYNIPKMNHH